MNFIKSMIPYRLNYYSLIQIKSIKSYDSFDAINGATVSGTKHTQV